ncbi:MAG: hypothetical protein RI896_391, partial [Pseudomonadota bacterium]
CHHLQPRFFGHLWLAGDQAVMTATLLDTANTHHDD